MVDEKVLKYHNIAVEMDCVKEEAERHHLDDELIDALRHVVEVADRLKEERTKLLKKD